MPYYKSKNWESNFVRESFQMYEPPPLLFIYQNNLAIYWVEECNLHYCTVNSFRINSTNSSNLLSLKSHQHWRHATLRFSRWPLNRREIPSNQDKDPQRARTSLSPPHVGQSEKLNGAWKFYTSVSSPLNIILHIQNFLPLQ